MPELPEVETLRRSLEPHLLGRTVAAAACHRRDVVVLPGDPFGGFPRQRGPQIPRPRRLRAAHLLAGETIERLARHGKRLEIRTAAGPLLAVHLGMTGQLLHRPAGARPRQTDHVHLTWRLDDGARLVFRDPRRFGLVRSLPGPHTLAEDPRHALGPDALDISAEHLAAALARARRPLKAALLDQTRIAGLGNIYADEACHAARIDPHATAADLTPDRIATLAAAIRVTLAAAVAARGSTLRDYADANGAPGGYQLAHAVYGRAGLPCHACGTPLQSAQLAARTTVWCPSCQK